MQDLTIHIGYPKTATTTLQTHIFPHYPGYVGKFHVGDARRPDGLRTSRRMLEAFADGVLSPAVVQEWVGRLQAGGSDAVLFSDETLMRWPASSSVFWPFHDGWSTTARARPHPVIGLLREIRRIGGIRLRVVVTVRNQTDLMASLYSQIQTRLRSPSQQDFERKVEELIATADPWFDFAALVDELDAAVGSENCLVLLYEDGVEQHAVAIADFLGWHMDVLPETIGRENVQRASATVWNATWSAPLTKRGVFLRLRRILDRTIGPRLGSVERPAKQMLARMDAAASRLLTPKRITGVPIETPGDLLRRVRQHFAPANRRLGERLGRDLTSLGY